MNFTKKEKLNRFSIYPWSLDYNDEKECYEIIVEDLDDFIICSGISDKRVAEYLLSIHAEANLYTKIFTIENEKNDFVDIGVYRFNYKLKTIKNLETNESKKVPHRRFQLICLLYNNKDRSLTRKELAFKMFGRSRYHDERMVGVYLARLRDFLGGKHIEMIDSKRVRLNLE